MSDITTLKQWFKNASDDDARRAYEWIQVAMEVRGLIEIPGTRKRRSDAGKPRAEAPADSQLSLKDG